MKKLFSLLLALTLLCLVGGAIADTIPAGEMEISMVVDRADDVYIVTIPAAVEIDAATQRATTTIKLQKGFKLVSCNSLKVRLAGAENGIGNKGANHSMWEYPSDHANFKLKDQNGNTCSYAVGPNIYNGFYDRGSYSYSCSLDYKTYNLIYADKTYSNTSDIPGNLYFYVPTMPAPGTYTDTLTFEIIIE